MNERTMNDFAVVIHAIKSIINKARYNSFRAVNAEMLRAYYEIGRKIVEVEQKGEMRAEYGRQLIETISQELSKDFDRGFGVSSLKNMRLFYHVYKHKISQSLTDEFSK